MDRCSQSGQDGDKPEEDVDRLGGEEIIIMGGEVGGDEAVEGDTGVGEEADVVAEDGHVPQPGRDRLVLPRG